MVIVGVKELLPNRNEKSVFARAFKIGVKYLTYNKDYFEDINTTNKAYWLGFMYADGCVTTKNRWYFGLQSADAEHVQYFLNDFNCNTRVRLSKNDTFCSFMIKNKKMYDDLVDKGVVRGKTFCLTFPDESILKKKYYSHFIRGFFDGDGCLYYKQVERKNRPNKNQTFLAKEINFVCASLEFITKFKSVIEEECGVKFPISIVNRKDCKPLPTLRIGNKADMKTFLNYMYQNSTKFNRLSRKYEKSQILLNCHFQ